MTARHKHVKKVIASLTNYMATYNEQPGYLSYTDETIINDVLYGLGIALNAKEYQLATGYSKFKDRLRKHLNAK